MTGWNIQASPSIVLAKNPIRSTLATITADPPETTEELINLALGDPTVSKLHAPPEAATCAVERALRSEEANGYLHGSGSTEARQAVADYHKRWDGVPYETDQIILTHGASHALDMIFNVLVPPASSSRRPNLLIPRPGFSLYKAQLASLGVEIREYDCIEEQGWEADLEMMEQLCDSDTVAILVTNPSNPCGSNYTKSHLEGIIAVAEKHKVPIIADEIYAHMTWNSPFIPLASISTVPILTLSGLSKRFLVPGWRFGWIALHDPMGVARSVKDALNILANRILGPNSLIQAALPEILQTGPEWFDEVTDILSKNAAVAHECIAGIPGLSASYPKGAMYLFVRIDPHLGSDVEFSRLIYKHQAVFVLPGTCFGAPGYFRISVASPAEVLRAAGSRIRAFCQTRNGVYNGH